MLQLSDLLSRFKNLTNTEKARKELVSVEVSRIIGAPISHQQISFSKNTIFIKVPPIIKTEIALQKEKILQTIKNLPGLNHVSDIQ